VATTLTPGGRFVLGDVVVPEAEQLSWLTAAGLQARVAWARRDLAVLVGDAPSA
jgi:tRNA (cmo5U34)-methyltransferase